MEKSEVRSFFDRLAPSWDDELVRNESAISYILDAAGVRKGVSVLDVACGTGVLFGDYLGRGVASLTAVDISPEMVSIARSKYPEVEVICADAEKTAFSRAFDVILIYNAFPHFPSPAGTISALSRALAPGGRLTVAHGMSREALIEHHRGTAASVSLELPPADELAAIFARCLDVDLVLSDDEKYIVSGTLR